MSRTALIILAPMALSAALCAAALVIGMVRARRAAIREADPYEIPVDDAHLSHVVHTPGRVSPPRAAGEPLTPGAR
ncbi:hypothetical protein [Pannonibacter tanglangensis]|uniref:Uncharacterized protein n=1 Tax=Pannonibacter tanglangensis TaxID=2750084 RepID=A0ABW9ZHJ8_9HYPH|nr:hypothetical protein [Pannonibacter sp. XCT-34]NBN64173.1 hypothetical protein [Pannonibacter sp. XCT-34]